MEFDKNKDCPKCKQTKDIKEFIKVNKKCNACLVREKEKRMNKTTKSKDKENNVKNNKENYVVILREKLKTIVSSDLFEKIMENKE